jgi:hypothetical protein
MITIRIVIAAGLALLLAGCASDKILTSIPGGESKVFERPPYVVLGKTRYDQNWIDSQVEGGVAAFGWPRPAPRPPQLDAKPGQKIVAAAPKKKRGLIRRIKDRILPTKTPAPTEVPVEAPPPVVATPEPLPPPPPPPPKSDVDELLNPSVPLPPARRSR